MITAAVLTEKISILLPLHESTHDHPFEMSVVVRYGLPLPAFPLIRIGTGMEESFYGSRPGLIQAVNDIGIVGEHPKIKESLEIAAALAPSDIPVLILGETGTGKELFARLIHALSGRSDGPFVPLNCAAIPLNLVESVLFGHKKGAFTGADCDQEGRFDSANGGTLFLDEVGELPPEVQAKCLRVLEDGCVEPLGASGGHRVDVRVLTATNKDLIREVLNGNFREDMYYRLSAGEIKIPPLRERSSDIPGIVRHVLNRLNADSPRPRQLTGDAIKRLQAHSWPGNIRDLENVLARSILLSRKDVLGADDIFIAEPVSRKGLLESLPEPEDGFSLEEYLGAVRKQLMLRAVELSGGNKSAASKLLGITPQAVHKFMRASG